MVIGGIIDKQIDEIQAKTGNMTLFAPVPAPSNGKGIKTMQVTGQQRAIIRSLIEEARKQ